MVWEADSAMNTIFTLSLILCISKSKISNINGDSAGKRTLALGDDPMQFWSLSQNYFN